MATFYGMRERALRRGGSYRRHVAALDRDQWLPAGELEELQNRRVREMVRFCVSEVPHWRDLFARLGLAADDLGTASDLAKLPVLEKEDVRAAPERFVPDHPPARLIPSSTGGTTGTPLRYFVTPDAVQFNAAIYDVRFRHWAGVRFGQRMASINGQVVVPAGQRRPPFWRHNLAFHQLYLSAWHLTPEHLPAYVERLRRFQPEVVVGYVSTVHVLARHLLESGGAGSITPRAVLLSSEALYPWLRADIEAAFGCRAYNGYSLGELTAFVSECDAGTLHVSPEYGVVELVDMGAGTEIVSSGLFNRGMPLLRYRTGDAAAAGAGTPCSCGRQLPALAEITGRADDRVETPEGLRVGPAPLSLAFQGVPGLRQAQVVQHSVEEVTVLLVVGPGFDPDGEDRLRAELAARLGTGLRTVFERVEDIPRTAAGKHRLVVTTLGRDH